MPFLCIAVTEDQLARLLAKLKENPGLKEKLKGTESIDLALEIAKEFGFDITIKAQNNYPVLLSDTDLDGVSGGAGDRCLTYCAAKDTHNEC